MILCLISANDKLLKKLHNLKAEELAKKIGVKRRIIFMYEKDDSKSNYEVLIVLADYFKVSLDYLVSRSDKPEK
ncbi:helix-turn-helix domain-containing protein [Pelorhabdus rhamnosifermentans]|uniref:helix-turn-helix domain-containing protein n=1 Tax=Pelorhabdus rhamnosifermentans TaxID=2772457 RepID=UPI001C05F704|nr:helix-turn-helix domain-containing protein [Pelorhabdus rhamnosifermentans]